jgi:carboxymethylenebutenolidase
VDGAGRAKTYRALTEANVHFEWLELNGMHAFMRDEGYRYDPYLESLTLQHAVHLFHRKLHGGDRLASSARERGGAINAKM